jgi:hypothetical protein
VANHKNYHRIFIMISLVIFFNTSCWIWAQRGIDFFTPRLSGPPLPKIQKERKGAKSTALLITNNVHVQCISLEWKAFNFFLLFERMKIFLDMLASLAPLLKFQSYRSEIPQSHSQSLHLFKYLRLRRPGSGRNVALSAEKLEFCPCPASGLGEWNFLSSDSKNWRTPVVAHIITAYYGDAFCSLE